MRRPRPDNNYARSALPSPAIWPFAPVDLVSSDELEAIHNAALGLLSRAGLRFCHPEAIALFRAAGARIEDQTVRIGPEIVAAALASAPRRFTLHAPDPALSVEFGPGAMIFHAGAGCPHVHDRVKGRRAATLADFVAAQRLIAGAASIHLMGAAVEPQDSAPERRHFDTGLAQMDAGAKPPFVYARGRAQVMDAFELLALSRGETALNHAFCFTVVNSNSPRLFDKPMAEGLIDFARAGQVVMMTPFCLMGAMAPVTIGGALVLQHAEALAGITLSQLARPGAPVVYGSFASNVDLRSGAPAFGTPEQVKATLISGQLARRIGLPWRASAGTSAPLADAQAAMETGAGVWAAALAGATITVHAAGWLEGGLTFGFEKFIADLDLLDLQCELRRPVETDPDALALEALAAIAPAGHFFGEAHTLARYRTAFHAPGLASTQGFEAWQETGRPDAETRATAVWQGRLGAWTPPEPPPGIETARAFAARRIAAGGATPG